MQRRDSAASGLAYCRRGFAEHEMWGNTSDTFPADLGTLFDQTREKGNEVPYGCKK